MESKKTYISVLFLLTATSISACCGEIQLPSSIIAEPLYQAEIPQDTNELKDILNETLLDLFDREDLYLFPKIMYGSIQSSSGVVWVLIELFSTEAESKKRYDEECNDNDFQDPQKFTYGGYLGNQYCISYLTQMRSDPEGLCVPMDEYASKAIFQKGRILINLEEWASNNRNEQINQVIEIFAEQLSKK